MASPLRAVKADYPANPGPICDSVAAAAASGDHRALFVAMRDRIAKAVSDPDCPPRDLAALTRRLQDIAKELDALDSQAKREASEDAGVADHAWDEASI